MVRFQVIRASHIVMAAFVFLIAVAVVGFMVRVLPAISAAGETPEPVSAPIVVDHQVSLEDGRTPALFSPQDSAKPSRGQDEAVSRERAALDILASDEPDEVVIRAEGEDGGEAAGETGAGMDASWVPAQADTPGGTPSDAREATRPADTGASADAQGAPSDAADGRTPDAATGNADTGNADTGNADTGNAGASGDASIAGESANPGGEDANSPKPSDAQASNPNGAANAIDAANANSAGASAPDPESTGSEKDAAGNNTAAVEVDPAYQTSSANRPDAGAVEVFITLEEHEEADPSDPAAMRDAEEIRIEMPGNSPRVGEGAPSVLLYHTHTHEAYAQVSGDPYVEAGKWRSSDDLHNIVRVGDELTRSLEQAGFAVTHDETDHEPPRLGTAYTRSLKTLEGYGESIKGFDWVIDLHRDAYSEAQKQLTVPYAGKDCARLMMLIGTGEGDEKSQFTVKPNWKVNYQLAQQLTDELNRICPGICRPVMIKTGRYNQHMSERSILVEVGNNRNTLEQAENSMRILAQAMQNLTK